MKTKIYSILLLLVSAFFIVSCSKEPSSGEGFAGEPSYKYFLLSALGSWPNTVHYMTATNDLTQGEMDLKREGDEVNTKGTYAYIVKNGFIYNYKTDQGVFKKMKFTMDQLVTVQEIPYSFIEDISTFTWIDSRTLVLVGATEAGRILRYSIIDVETMEIKKQGDIQGLDAFPKEYPFYNLGAVAYVDGELFLQYGYRNPEWMTSLFYNLAKLSYPDFKVISSNTDDRSAGVSNGSPYFKTTFIVDNQTFYYACTPRLETGQNETYLYRANKGDSSYDPDFSINLSALVNGNELLTTIDYIGDNKAMIVYRDPSLGKSYNARYAIVDLNTRQLVRVLDELPADEPYEQGFFVENLKVNIAVNSSSKEGNFVWIYDVKTDKVQRGMRIPDHISGFARFDKLFD